MDEITDFDQYLAFNRERTAAWAREVLAHPEKYLILDTETTGLRNAEFVQLSMIDLGGRVIVNTLAKPSIPIEPGAQQVHGISMEQLADAPTYAQLYPHLARAVDGRIILAYNAAFDSRVIEQTARNHGAPNLCPDEWQCVMLQYAAYFGQWDEYHESFKWQKLQGGDHSALGDCRATLDVLKRMAGG